MADFIVIKYYISVLGVTDTSPHWGKVKAVRNKDTGKIRTELQEIDRSEALSLIKDYGLVCTLESKDGRIYDTADKHFQEKYKGKISINLIA